MSATNKFINAILNNKNVLLTGGAGVGKTWHINKLESLTPKETRVAYLATTGIATTHMKDGMTVHRYFGLGPFMDKDFVINKWENSSLFNRIAPLLKEVDRIIIDEVSMLRNDLFDMIDLMCKIARKSEKPFGGIQMILVGDFFQLAPIVQDGEDIENPFMFNSEAFYEGDFVTVNLTKVYRQKDSHFSDALNEIRAGKISEKTLSLLRGRVNKELEHEPMFLASANKKVDAYNDEKLDELKGKIVSHEAFVWSKEKKYFKQLEKDQLTPIDLELKFGCRVLITKNDPSDEMEYVNGNLGTFHGFERKMGGEGADSKIEDMMIVKLDNEKIVYLPTVTMGVLNPEFDLSNFNSHFNSDWENYTKGGSENYRFQQIVDNDEDMKSRDRSFLNGRHKLKVKRKIMLKLKFNAYMTQYPVKLGYAITIHKSQGMSLDYVKIDFKGIFSAGQSYVALSRATSLEGLSISNLNPSRHIFEDRHARSFYKFL